jgi:hypothetical protein
MTELYRNANIFAYCKVLTICYTASTRAIGALFLGYLDMTATLRFTSQVRHDKAKTLRCLHGMLEHDGVTSREQFSDLMKAAFVQISLTPTEIADDLGYSLSSQIVSWIMATIETRLSEMDKLDEGIAVISNEFA